MSRPLASRRLAGTVRLTGLALRRDWPATAVWMITFAGLLTAAQAGFRETYPDAAALAAYALVVEASPVQHFFNGPGAGLASRGGMVVFEIGGYLLVVAAVVAILTTIRHSRRAEADSTGEMVRAGAVGCLAPLSSASAAALAQAALLATACVSALGAAGLGWAGAVTYGLSMLAVGAIYTAVAAVASQLFAQPRSAAALAGAALAADFIVRGVRDMNGQGPFFASPLSWAYGLRPFAGERYWPLAAVAAVVLAGHGLAAWLDVRRDFGQGWWPARPGPDRARAGLRRVGGLVWSQRRPTALAWTAVLGLLSFAFGLVSIEFAAGGESLDLSVFVGGDSGPAVALVDFCSLLVAVLAAAAGVSLVSAAARDETSGRLDEVLAGAVGRGRWLAAEAFAALGAACGSLALAGLGLAGGVALAGDLMPWSDPLAAVVARAPAVAVVVAGALALLGLGPRWPPAAWALVAYSVVVGLFGQILRLPDWAADLSAFEHLARLGDDSWVTAAAGWEVAVAATLTAAGWAALRRRDLG